MLPKVSPDGMFRPGNWTWSGLTSCIRGCCGTQTLASSMNSAKNSCRKMCSGRLQHQLDKLAHRRSVALVEGHDTGVLGVVPLVPS